MMLTSCKDNTIDVVGTKWILEEHYDINDNSHLDFSITLTFTTDSTGTLMSHESGIMNGEPMDEIFTPNDFTYTYNKETGYGKMNIIDDKEYTFFVYDDYISVRNFLGGEKWRFRRA